MLDAVPVNSVSEAIILESAVFGEDQRTGGHSRLPDALIDEAVAVTSTRAMTIAAFARQHNVNQVTLRAAVRRRLARGGGEGTIAAIRQGAACEEMQRVEALQAEGMTLRDACRMVGVNYHAAAKRLSRSRRQPLFEALQAAMLAAGVSEADLIHRGAQFRTHKDAAVPKGMTYADWLGSAFVDAARRNGVDPEPTARDFVRWKAGRF